MPSLLWTYNYILTFPHPLSLFSLFYKALKILWQISGQVVSIKKYCFKN